jgi:hypothetical protein
MESKIIRRPDFAGGGVTDEEREKLAAHSQLWIQSAFRTEPADPRLIKEAVKGLYRAANIEEPRVIFVPSPLVMAMAGGIAATWWYLFRRNLFDKQRARGHNLAAAVRGATSASTRDAIGDATRNAADSAINAATDRATRDVVKWLIFDLIYEATYNATYAATRDAIRTATGDTGGAATDRATYAATRAAIYAATDAVAYDVVYEGWNALASGFVGAQWAEAAFRSAAGWDKVCQSGNMYVVDDCYLTAARDILGLNLPQNVAYSYWEQAATGGGFRWMHPKFCFVSELPEILRVNADNQPHAEFGPSHRWREGRSIRRLDGVRVERWMAEWSLWHLNGVRVEQWMAESHPDRIDARRVLQIENVDQRREVIRRMGMERIVGQLKPMILDTERREVGGEYRLLAVDMNHGEPWRFLQMVNQSTSVTHIEAVPRECETVRQAINWRSSQNINKDWFPTILS